MKVREFEFCALEVGIQRVGGVKIVCGKCGMTGTVRRGSSNHEDTEVQHKRYARGFERLGWKIGARPQDDRCPACVSAIEAAKRPVIVSNQEKPMNANAAATTAAPPRAMSPADGRIIIAKLDDVYDTGRQTYRAPWTDHRVSEDLGVPRAWIADVRHQFYGPEGSNAEIDATLTEAKTLLSEARSLLGRIEQAKSTVGALNGEAQKLAGRADSIERKVAGIEKAVRA